MRATKMQQMFIKEQTAANTWPWSTDPVAGEVLPVYNVELPGITGDALKRTGTRASFTPIPIRAGKRAQTGSATGDLVVYTTDALMAAALAATTPMGILLKAADLSLTAVSATHYKYAPQSGSQTLFSVIHAVDGLAYKAIDMKSGFKLTMKAGELCQFIWSLTGRWYDTAAALAAVVATSTFASARVAENTTTIQIAIGGTTYDVDFNSFTLDWSPTIIQRTGHRGQYGVKDSRITGRDPSISIDCEMGVDATDLALLAAFESATPVTFIYRTAESAPYFEIRAYGQITEIAPKDDGGEARHNIKIDLSSETQEGELELHWYTP